MTFTSRIAAMWRGLTSDSIAAAQPPRMNAQVYGGAQVNRLFRDWITSTLSADGEVRLDQRELRRRARQLVRDNATASGYVNELANQVIGPKGVMLQARATMRDGKTPAGSTNLEIERGWKLWGMPETCSADRRTSWLDIQRLLVKSLAMDGELILRELPYFNNAFGYAVQLIDPDLLDETYNRPRAMGADGENEIRMGVEIDDYGAAVNYWLWTRHPSQPSSGIELKRVPVPAAEIRHYFVAYRPGQTRGVSWLAPVMADLKMLAGIQEAELVATRMGAAKFGFLVQKNPEAFGGTASPTAGTDAVKMEAAPGVIDELPPGWEFQGFDPTHPSTAFDPFTKAIRRDISRGVNMAYATLTGDLESVNYSSMRAGILPERDFYRSVAESLATHVFRPVQQTWMRMAVLTGAIRVDARLASEYPVEWRGRGWPWVDPANDATAFETLRRNGLATRQDATAERGLDYEEVIDKLAAEQQYADEKGVDVSGTVVRRELLAPGEPIAEDNGAAEPGAPKAVPSQSGPTTGAPAKNGTTSARRPTRRIA